MKVLNKVDTSNWSYKFICGSCDSELLAEKSDVKRTYYAGDFREPSSENFSCKCAVCGNSHNIPPGSIPKAMKVELKKSQEK